MWDGKIRLINNLTGYVYAGLARHIKKFCDARNYTFSFDEELYYDGVSEHELREFINTLGIPEKYAIRDYQFDSILKCIRSNRRTLVSPTSSGKSLMIYILMRWYQKHKALIIVPTIGLVNQMESDFRDYGYTGNIHLSTQGLSKSNNIEIKEGVFVGVVGEKYKTKLTIVSIEEKYTKLSQHDHILTRPDTYIGDINGKQLNMWIFSDNEEKIIKKEILKYSLMF
jgi:superfamily II DNA or RNA helicase